MARARGSLGVAVAEWVLIGASGVEVALHASGSRLLVVVPVVLVTALLLRRRTSHPGATMVGFCGLFAVEAFLLAAAEQVTALLVWGLLAYAVGRQPRARALAGIVPTLLPLVIFKAAEPARAWLDFAPATGLLVLACWFGGSMAGRRPGPAARGVTPVPAEGSRLATADAGDVRAAPSLGALSDREQQVLDLIATGMTNPQIAEALYVSRATVKTHVSHILTKLDVEDRVQAAVLATRAEGVRGTAHESAAPVRPGAGAA